MEFPLETLAPFAVGFILVVSRLSGIFLFAPVFSSGLIPPRLKIMMVIALSALLTPLVATGVAVPESSLVLGGMIFLEVLIGVAMGYALAVIIAAIQMAAHFIDLTIGFALANVADPLNNSQASVFGAVYSMTATLIFLAIDGHHLVIEAFTRSYFLIQPGEVYAIPVLAMNVLEMVTVLFLDALRIALPVVITLMLADIVLGLIARVVPQMNVFFVGIPMKIGVGMAAIALTLPALSTFLTDRIEDVVAGLKVLELVAI